ncbi:16097_t:CDS:2 [Funneliformis caledonium]|uniref:16097_t:CDS:1 n=1 Tax=Funneliformis caledonium TaxID=1117310 RepID=A0A9N9DAA2_9GLOM|nr:16097_t:CDS:2 [Funneliformis caledonium]
MAILSKLVISTKLAANCENNLLQIQTDVKLSLIFSSKDNNSTLNPSASPSHPLSPNFITALNKHSCTVSLAIILLLNYVKKVIDTSNSSILSAIEDLNLQDLNDYNLATINEFKVAKQALYNNISSLIMCIQIATISSSFLSTIDQVLVCTNVIDKSVKDVMIATKFLVKEKDTLKQMRVQGIRSRHSRYLRRLSNINLISKIRLSNNSNPLDQIDENDTADNQSISTSRHSNNVDSTSKICLSNNSNSPDQIGENDIAEDQSISTLRSSGNVDLRSKICPLNNSNSLDQINLQAVLEGCVDDSSIIIGEDFSADNLISLIPSKHLIASRLRSNSSAIVASFNSFSSSTRINTPSITNTNSTVDPSEIVFHMENCVKGETLNALAERLIMHDILDSNFIAIFLLIYRSFCITDNFFDMLIKRFMIQLPENLTHIELEIWQERK